MDYYHVEEILANLYHFGVDSLSSYSLHYEHASLS